MRCMELSNAPQASKPDDNAPPTTSREASDEYTGAITPVCELDRRQHLLSLNVMYKVWVGAMLADFATAGAVP